MSLAAAAELQARVLRGGRDLRAEYPLVFEDGAPGRVLALVEDGRVRSAASSPATPLCAVRTTWPSERSSMAMLCAASTLSSTTSTRRPLSSRTAAWAPEPSPSATTLKQAVA